MKSWAERHKPSAPVSTHLMSACLLWGIVGAGLLGVGSWWLAADAPPRLVPWFAAGALAAGWLKSRLVLDPVAHKVVRRIADRGDGRCLGGFLSLRTWALVVVMMVAGRALRATVVGWAVGVLSVAIGTALLLSCRLSWLAWRESRRGRGATIEGGRR